MRQELRRHVQRFHSEDSKVNPCPDCDLTFADIKLLNCHRTEFHNVVLFECHLCDKAFNLKRYLQQHFRLMHPEVKYFHCKSCPDSFSTRAELKTHQATHSDRYFDQFEKNDSNPSTNPFKNKRKSVEEGEDLDQIFVCNDCGAEIQGVLELKKHMKKVHPEARPFRCQICGRTFKKQSQLEEHENAIHFTTSLDFQCDQCKRNFKTKKLLRSHMRSHSDLRPHKCSECASAFKMRQELKRHFLRKHTAEDPEKCSTCQMTFKRRKEMMNHQATAHGIALLECELCEKTFLTQRYLQKHLETHSSRT